MSSTRRAESGGCRRHRRGRQPACRTDRRARLPAQRTEAVRDRSGRDADRSTPAARSGSSTRSRVRPIFATSISHSWRCPRRAPPKSSPRAGSDADRSERGESAALGRADGCARAHFARGARAVAQSQRSSRCLIPPRTCSRPVSKPSARELDSSPRRDARRECRRQGRADCDRRSDDRSPERAARTRRRRNSARLQRVHARARTICRDAIAAQVAKLLDKAPTLSVQVAAIPVLHGSGVDHRHPAPARPHGQRRGCGRTAARRAGHPDRRGRRAARRDRRGRPGSDRRQRRDARRLAVAVVRVRQRAAGGDGRALDRGDAGAQLARLSPDRRRVRWS